MEVSQNEAISEGVKVWVVAVSCLRQGKQSARLSTVRFVGGEPPIPPLFFSAHTQPGPPQNLALLTNCAQEKDYAVWNGREQEKRRRLASEGSSYHPF